MKTKEAKIARFNRVYADKAKPGMSPYETYIKMRDDGFVSIDIANHFGVQPVTVASWVRELS